MAIITLHTTECHVRKSNCGSKNIITGNVICPYICSFHIFLLNFLIKSKGLIKCMYRHIHVYSHIRMYDYVL